MSDCKVWIGSLADYNSGTLHGAWIDLDDCNSLDDLQERVQAIMDSSPYTASEFAQKYGLVAEEWEIMDHEGFGTMINSYSSLDHVWEIYELIEEHGEAFIAYYENCGCTDASQFQDSYQGEYNSEMDFCYDLVDDTGLLDGMPESLQCYFDYEAFCRDLFMCDYSYINGHVFRVM